MGLPPFWYSTHVVAPLLYLSESYAQSAVAFGSGVMRDERSTQYGNPFPIEHAMTEQNTPNLMAEITRSLFRTAIGYVEGSTVLGENISFEWDIYDFAEYVFNQHASSAYAINSFPRAQSPRFT